MTTPHAHTTIGIVAIGVYLPLQRETAADVAQRSGIPEAVLRAKFGINAVYRANDAELPTMMAANAARQALANAQMCAEEIDLIIYHGSEYKDYIVWSAAAHIQQLIGAHNAAAYEIYALCAGAPIALHTARALMLTEPHLRHVLLVSASRENDLVDPTNPNTRFMLNFSAGASAMLLRRNEPHNQVLSSAMKVDGTLSTHVIIPAGGCRLPPSAQTVRDGQHLLDVPDMAAMRDQLGAVSLPNFVHVIDEAVSRSGAHRSDINFVCITHMKPSFHLEILHALGLHENQSFYLSDYGHMQSVDQPLALMLAAQQGMLHDGDLVVLAGAGTGYTWSATAVRWGISS